MFSFTADTACPVVIAPVVYFMSLLWITYNSGCFSDSGITLNEFNYNLTNLQLQDVDRQVTVFIYIGKAV